MSLPSSSKPVVSVTSLLVMTLGGGQRGSLRATFNPTQEMAQSSELTSSTAGKATAPKVVVMAVVSGGRAMALMPKAMVMSPEMRPVRA